MTARYGTWMVVRMVLYATVSGLNLFDFIVNGHNADKLVIAVLFANCIVWEIGAHRRQERIKLLENRIAKMIWPGS